MRRIVLFGVLGVAVLALAVAAIAKPGHDRSLRSTLAPSVPTDPQIHGINAGGVPWQLSRGTVDLHSDGKLKVDIRGLVIPSMGNPGPVATVSASLFCSNNMTTTPDAKTGSVPLSSRGDAKIDQRISLPAECLGPVVFVNPNGNAAAYIAVTGWKS